MSNNIIDLNTLENGDELQEANLTKIGNINIAVYSTDICNSPIYYILPDRKELLPIVDLLDDTLTNNSFKLSQEVNIHKI